MLTDRQTDRQRDRGTGITKLKVVLRNFAKAPKCIFAILSQILKSTPFKNLVFEEKIIIL